MPPGKSFLPLGRLAAAKPLAEHFQHLPGSLPALPGKPAEECAGCQSPDFFFLPKKDKRIGVI